jgi:UDP-N-acetylglucosamine--N-acetylmuramyl-(pentapeptide) pyrophosphoryl-undecaprenol N-acetylglucosamine transferase
MDREMKAADLVVCRAGATTLAELTAAGRPSILVPLPTATDDHQRKNALVLVRRGAARLLEQHEMTGERIAADILGLAADKQARAAMTAAARQLARPDAARMIVDRVLELGA